jgi:hypothetical protein
MGGVCAHGAVVHTGAAATGGQTRFGTRRQQAGERPEDQYRQRDECEEAPHISILSGGSGVVFAREQTQANDLWMQ